jgi:hypothetical protein
VLEAEEGGRIVMEKASAEESDFGIERQLEEIKFRKYEAARTRLNSGQVLQ